MTLRALFRSFGHWLTHEPEDVLEESTRLRIKGEAEDADQARELREQLIVPKPRPESPEPTPRDALSKPWPGGRS